MIRFVSVQACRIVLNLVALGFLQSPQPTSAPTLLRVGVGPGGQVRNGEYVLDEERARFDPARDKQVVVLFQWEGTPGEHKMIALWKSPDGASSTTPPVSYSTPGRRFGAFWPLTLSAATATGTWTVEATVDGQPAGRITFDVGSDSGGAAPSKPARQILTQPQLFTRLTAAFVGLERSTSKGRRLDPAAAVPLGHGRLVTSLAAVDGADVLTAVLADGKRQPITGVLGINRAHDWIVLAGGPEGDLDQTVTSEASVQIGDRCFSMEAVPAGSRILVDSAVIGRAGSPASGPRVVINLPMGTGMPGGPVFTEFGELVGFIGGSLVPGTSDLSDLIAFRAELRGAPVVPLSTVAVSADAKPLPFADVWGRGDILHAVEGREHVISGGFAKTILRDQTVHPADQRQEFSKSDKEFVVFITWGPQARLRGASTLRMYNQSNQVTAESQPSKLDVKPGYPSTLSSWKMPIPATPGIYRAEVLIDGVPIWRGFVRITE